MLQYTICRLHTIQTCIIHVVMDDVFSLSRKSADWPHYFCFTHSYKNLLNMFSSGLQEIISLPDRST